MPDERRLDEWAEWLLRRRHGGDEEQRQADLARLVPIRDKVLRNARIQSGDFLVDVGAGAGLIAFGALPLVGERGKILLTDVSEDLLGEARSIASEMGVLEGCQFIKAAAEDLSSIESASVDVVTTRSVLIYVKEKRRAFEEFHRVLKPDGRISLYEPINGYFPDSPEFVWGFDVTPVMDLAQKVWAVYQRIQPPSDPMLDFDERDLVAFADQAGFGEVHLELDVDIEPGTWTRSWETFLNTAGNPLIPTTREAIEEALTPEEAARFERHLRPLVESGQGTRRSASAYLWAVKP